MEEKRRCRTRMATGFKLGQIWISHIKAGAYLTAATGY